MLQLLKQYFTIARFASIALIIIKHLLITQIVGLKTEQKCLFKIQTKVTIIIGKTAIWKNFCFWVSPPNYTTWAFMFLMQQSHVQWRVLWNFLCNAVVLFYLKKSAIIRFRLTYQVFKLLFQAPKNVKTYIIVTWTLRQ